MRHSLPLVGRCAVLAVLFTTVAVGRTAVAQDEPIQPPETDSAVITIHRGRDVVQAPSLWYQEGTSPPDSLGSLRVPRPPSDPDALAFPALHHRFPVSVQVASFVRDGQVAELPVSASVLNGTTPGRIIIRPPHDDHYDIAVPFGVDPIKQVPGEETIIDVRAWYEASLYNPIAETYAPSDDFHTTRELRGRLRSTASGGESVFFVIVARPKTVRFVPTPLPTFAPVNTRAPMPEVQGRLTIRATPRTTIEWITSTGFLAGWSQADIPGRRPELYEAVRIRGDAVSSLRWYRGVDERYELTVYGSTQATLSSEGSHNDVPYGLGIGARFGEETALELRAEAGYEDDPFQAQSFASGDERLRLLFGVDRQTDSFGWGISVGPTYFRDRPSSWETQRDDARELGFSAHGALEKRARHRTRHPIIFGLGTRIDQTLGYIRDAGNTNMALEGRASIKIGFIRQAMEMAVGPVAFVQYTDSRYADVLGFTEFNTQFGLEATTRITY